MKNPILKLNANYIPIGTGDWQSIIIKILSGSVHPVDIAYAQNDDGSYDKNTIEFFYVTRSWDEWAELPIRPCDEYVQGPQRAFRLPSVVVCSNYNKVRFKKVQFPTKRNIWARDNYTCCYSGKKLSKEDVSIDHIIPASKGGQNTWENLVTCDKALNVWKADRTPKECGLTLLIKPTKPTNGLVFDYLRDEWKIFVGGKHE